MPATIASHRGRSLQTLSGELRRVVGELDDARNLTWSAELSDTFGRSQTQIRSLIQELDARARNEAGSLREAAVRIEVRAEARQRDAGGSRQLALFGFLSQFSGDATRCPTSTPE